MMLLIDRNDVISQCDIWLNCCESWVRMGYLRDAQRCYEIAARYARAAIREEMRRNAA